MVITIPKGFFPNQDTGTIFGLIEAAQDASPAEMMKLNQMVSGIIARDPNIEAFGSNLGNASTANTSNTGRFYMTLKPREHRNANAYEIIARLRAQFASLQGVSVFMQVPQDITVGGRLARGQYQYTLQDPDIGELAEWSSKMLAKMKTMPAVLADVSSDLLNNAPQLTVAINRDQASRFGISPQLIDDTFNDAFGQRQVVQYFTQVNTYWVILEVTPSLRGACLDPGAHLHQVAADRRGSTAVEPRHRRRLQGRSPRRQPPGPASGRHARIQPAA